MLIADVCQSPLLRLIHKRLHIDCICLIFMHSPMSPSNSQLVIIASLTGPELSTHCLSFPATPQIAQETVSSFEFGDCVGSVLHTFLKTQEILLNLICAHIWPGFRAKR